MSDIDSDQDARFLEIEEATARGYEQGREAAQADMQPEIDRLKAERDQLRTENYYWEAESAAKEMDKLKAERDQLQAKVAELREALLEADGWLEYLYQSVFHDQQQETAFGYFSWKLESILASNDSTWLEEHEMALLEKAACSGEPFK